MAQTQQTMYGTTFSVEIVPHRCNGCSIPYGLPEGFIKERRRDHQTWTCPNGCVRMFHEDPDEKQKLENEIGRLKSSLTHSEDQLQASARDLERTKGALLRDRQRFANGVCPCCNRSFENVARHMTSKHPDYDITKVESTSQPEFGCSCGRYFKSISGLHRHQTVQRSHDWYKPGKAWGAHLTKT